MKKIFDFPDDAWDGVREALCENAYKDQVWNPDYTGKEGESQFIPNPLTRDQFAEQAVLRYITERARNWMERMQRAPLEAQIQAAVTQRIEFVIANTAITTEE
jgi:hypothetical protein